jgi:hypothetical protein
MPQLLALTSKVRQNVLIFRRILRGATDLTAEIFSSMLEDRTIVLQVRIVINVHPFAARLVRIIPLLKGGVITRAIT